MGKNIFRMVLFPVGFLFFMVPAPESLVSRVALPLQFFVTKISATIIAALSIPVFREGNMLYFAQAQLEVAQACSGIHSLIALVMLAVLFAYFSKKGAGRKIILLASAIPIALFANIVRVSGTGILAYFYGQKVAEGFLHEFSGIVVFVFSFLLLYIEFSVLNKKPSHLHEK